MTNSPNNAVSRRSPIGAGLLALSILAGLTLAAVTASAQGNKPVQLVPLGPADAQSAPVREGAASDSSDSAEPLRLRPLAPAAGPSESAAGTESPQKPRTLIVAPYGTPAPETAPQTAPESAPEAAPQSMASAPANKSIEVTPLGALDPSSVGLLDADNGGFPRDMWAGTDRALVARLLPRLSPDETSPVMQSLLRRLLLTAADVPPGAKQQPSLLALRVDRLAAAGDMQSVTQLLQLAPQFSSDPILRLTETESLWLAGDHENACARAQEMVRQDDSEFWLKAMTFCRLLEGKRPAAMMSLAMLREEGAKDPGFYALMDRLTGTVKDPLKSLPSPTPLDIAMLRTARQPVPADAASSAGPAVLKALATAPNAPLDLRLESAERAEALGVLPVETLAQIYASIPFTEDELANAVSIAEKSPGVRTNALLYQVSQVHKVPAARAEALRAAWRSGRDSGHYFTSVRVNLPAVRALKPSPELTFAAADIGRALLVTGHVDEVVPWYELARQQAIAKDPDAAKAALELWALLQIGDPAGTVPWDPGFVHRWWEGLSGLADDQRSEHAEVLLTLLSALGYQISGSDWEPLFDRVSETATMPSPALWNGLRDASANGRLGETVLLSLIALSEGGVAETNLLSLSAVIEALREVGLGEDARKLALEAAVTHGL